MHEAAVAMALVEQALAAARAHGSQRIRKVEVRIGELQQIVPEALQVAFEASVLDTPAEGAELAMSIEPARALCRSCGTAFTPDLEVMSCTCPQCGEADVDWTAGREIILQSLECDLGDPADDDRKAMTDA